MQICRSCVLDQALNIPRGVRRLGRVRANLPATLDDPGSTSHPRSLTLHRSVTAQPYAKTAQSCARSAHRREEEGILSDKSDRETKQLFTRKVDWLLDQFRGVKDIPAKTGLRAMETASKAAGCKISASTWRNIRNGETTGSLETKRELAKLFRAAVPDFRPEWFDLPTMELFQAAVSGAHPNTYTVSLVVPTLSEPVAQSLNHWLPGLYICYRYSFEQNPEPHVAREVLRIWRADDGQHKFELHYVIGSGRPGGDTSTVRGFVVALGRTVMMVGVSGYRGRVIFWHFDHPDYDEGDRWCRFGLTATATGRGDRAPVAACTIFLKLEKDIPDWRWLCSKDSRVIGVLPIGEIMATDFPGRSPRSQAFENRHISYWIATFLENTPLKNTQYGVPETILHLNVERFRVRMEGIRQKLIADESVNAPFKSGWEAFIKANT